MREIQIDDLLASGYHEDASLCRRREWGYTLAIVFGLAVFAGSMVIIAKGSTGLGLGVAGAAWVWIVSTILIRHFSTSKDQVTGDTLEKCRARPRDLPNEEIVLVNHKTKTFARQVVARTDSCLPPGG